MKKMKRRCFRVVNVLEIESWLERSLETKGSTRCIEQLFETEDGTGSGTIVGIDRR